MQTERRQRNRVAVNFLVSETSGGQVSHPLLTDLSEDGIHLEAPAGLAGGPGHAPVVEIMLPGVRDIIFARCKVVREKSAGIFEQRALKFVNISPNHRLLLKRYVHDSRMHD